MGDIITNKIHENIWYIGIADRESKGFKKRAYTDEGVTYSTYLRDVGDGFCLIGTAPVKHAQRWIEAIESITDISAIKSAVVFGCESDRTGIKLLLEKNADITVIGDSKALLQIRSFLGKAIKTIEIRGRRRLKLGNGEFHFGCIFENGDNKSLYLKDKSLGAMFLADIVGSYYASEMSSVSEIYDSEYSAIYSMRLFGGVKKYCLDSEAHKRLSTISKIRDMCKEGNVTMLCPAYGPVWDENVEELFECLTEHTESKAPGKARIVIISDGNGYSRELASHIEEGINEEQSRMLEVVHLEIDDIPRDDAIMQMQNVDFFLLGASSEGGDVSKKIWDIVTSLKPSDVSGAKAAIFGSGAVDGKYAEGLVQRLLWLGMDMSTGSYIVQGQLSKEDCKAAYEYGYDISCIVRQIPNPRRPRYVKCLVCGEIFEASLGICPVCGVGLDQCVAVEQEETGFRMDTDRVYAIVGGGIAAVSAAEAIRNRDKTGTILMFSQEDTYPINRPMLTKDFKLMHELTEELFIHEPDWYSKNSIEFIANTTVTAIDPSDKYLIAAGADGKKKKHIYTKLIYAAGAECFIPPFKGNDKAGVIAIRHYSDLKAIDSRLKKTDKAVVIGGGVLGLEAAGELMRQNVKVTVLEAAPQILGRQADKGTAEYLKDKMRAFGVDCYDGISIDEITGDDEAVAVRLTDGRIFEAGLVIVSCGNRCNAEVAQKAGIKVERAIVVDDHMNTNIKDIYACGDCAQYNAQNYQLWQEAAQQGKVAGANAAGDNISYEESPMGMSFEGFGTSIYALGDSGKSEDIKYKLLKIIDDVDASRQSYWFNKGSLVGAIVIGRPNLTADVIGWVARGARHEEVIG